MMTISWLRSSKIRFVVVLITLGLFIIASYWMFIPTQLIFTITDESSGATVFYQPVVEGERFKIQFIHSVHLTPVEEYYRIAADPAIVLERVVYETYGVGNPSGPVDGERYGRQDGKLVIDRMNRRMKVIHQRIGQVRANHILEMSGRSVPFTTWSQPGSRVKLEVKEVSCIAFMVAT